MMPTPAAILRTLAFNLLFFGGTFCLALASVLSPAFGARWSVALGQAWSGWQRWLVVHVLGITVTVEGEVPDGPVLIVMKHESMFEAIDLPTLLRSPVPFAKAELLRIPLWGKVGLRFGVVPVERDQGAKALRAMRNGALEFASQGRPLVLFPEGTRVPHGSQPQLQAGFAGLYRVLDLPVVPVAVNSGPLLAGFWKRKGTITYRFDRSIPAGLPRAEAEARVHAAINALNSPEPR